MNGPQKYHEDNKTSSQQLRVLVKKLNDLNKKLKDSESLKSSFLSKVRNEINNPLNSIIGLSEQIMNGLNLEKDSILQHGFMIYSEAFDLDFQLRNIFIAAELEAGDVVLDIAYVDVDSLIRNTINSFRHKANEKKINVKYFFKSVYDIYEKILFKTDPEKLKLIVSNLLANSFEFSNIKGKVELVAKRDVQYLVLSVKDYGIGIDQKDQAVIFDRFRQLDNGITRKHRGHGLGLSITKDLVTLLGGTISVRSTKGKGSIFTVSVPESKIPIEADTSFSDDGNILVF